MTASLLAVVLFSAAADAALMAVWLNGQRQAIFVPRPTTEGGGVTPPKPAAALALPSP